MLTFVKIHQVLMHIIFPTSQKEMQALGWDCADMILVTGDAFIDHPSFGAAVIAHLARQNGLRVAVLPQPNWQDDLRDFQKLGKPKYFFAVTAGAMDSMVANYTARKRKRRNDDYTPGGAAPRRPDYATIVYSKILKKLYPDIPIILGGVEASLRRFTHYDYWKDTLLPGILILSGADLLFYGLPEYAFVDFVRFVHQHQHLPAFNTIHQVVYSSRQLPAIQNALYLPEHEQCVNNPKKFALLHELLEKEANKFTPRHIIQKTSDVYLIANPPAPIPDMDAFDLAFDLPFTRLPHPRYAEKPAIPAFEMIKHSITIHRGCFGGCGFCAIHLHQGKHIKSRSPNSIIHEVQTLSKMPYFKGHINDLGGPSANMWKMYGKNLSLCEKCIRPSCLFPDICKNLNFDHKPLIELYKQVMSVPGVKLLTIGSGIRYDMCIGLPADITKTYHTIDYLKQLLRFHVSGRLKVAPEHVHEPVLHLMRKPSFEKFVAFHKFFQKYRSENHLSIELAIYLIANHPGAKPDDRQILQKVTSVLGYKVETIQDFTPTPMTRSSLLYYLQRIQRNRTTK